MPQKNTKLDYLKNLEAEAHHQIKKESEAGICKEILLGIDYGEKHTGLAICEHGVILPLKILLTDHSTLLTQIMQIIKERNIQRVIWGLPIGINREENHICRQIRSLAKKLQSQTRSPYELVNERYSTQMTLKSTMKASASDKERSSRDSSRIDDLAAMRILEFYLNLGMIDA